MKILNYIDKFYSLIFKFTFYLSGGASLFLVFIGIGDLISNYSSLLKNIFFIISYILIIGIYFISKKNENIALKIIFVSGTFSTLLLLSGHYFKKLNFLNNFNTIISFKELEIFINYSLISILIIIILELIYFFLTFKIFIFLAKILKKQNKKEARDLFLVFTIIAIPLAFMLISVLFNINIDEGISSLIKFFYRIFGLSLIYVHIHYWFTEIKKFLTPALN